MKIFALVLALLAGVAVLPAQELTFCLDHSREGEPLAPGTTFELDQFGQQVDFLVRQEANLQPGKYYFFIDRQVDEGFREFDTRSLILDSLANWMALSYRFERSGRFRVVLLDSLKNPLARSELKVNVLRDVGGPSYYRDAQIYFSTEVRDGQAQDSLQRISLNQIRKTPLRIVLKHYRPLRTHRIFVDVWRGQDPPEYVETIEFEVEPFWLFTQFPYPFRKGGDYTLRIYSEEEIWIATGQIRVEQ